MIDGVQTQPAMGYNSDQAVAYRANVRVHTIDQINAAISKMCIRCHVDVGSEPCNIATHGQYKIAFELDPVVGRLVHVGQVSVGIGSDLLGTRRARLGAEAAVLIEIRLTASNRPVANGSAIAAQVQQAHNGTDGEACIAEESILLGLKVDIADNAPINREERKHWRCELAWCREVVLNNLDQIHSTRAAWSRHVAPMSQQG
jgi:hypothetical protein